MRQTSLAYRAGIRAAALLAPAAGVVHPKARRAHAGRRGAVRRLATWARESRDPVRPLAWFHAASVGEGLQAQGVIDALRERVPAIQVAFTHFSPSAEPLARRLAADVSDYLPYDLRSNADRLLDALHPELLVFSKADVWPELATHAAARGTAVALVAGTVSRGSGRLGWPARGLLAPGYGAIAAAAAVARPDAERLAQLGVPEARIEVLGDPRFDSVLAATRAVAQDEPLLRFGRGAPTMVAGSTWPRDEEVLLNGFARLRTRYPAARLILVPHEPTPLHLNAIERAAGRLGLPAPARLSTAETAAPLLLVDRVGVLARLYGAGTMAYVGGGFGSAGLHSVLEPAAWGIPVAFGPRWRDSRDAGLMLEAGAAEALHSRSSREASAQLQAVWESWIVDEPRRQAQGRRARQVVETGVGAASRSAAMLERLLPRRYSPTMVPS